MDDLGLLKKKIDDLQEKLSQQTCDYKAAISNDIFSEAKRLYNLTKITLMEITIAVEKLDMALYISHSEAEERSQNKSAPAGARLQNN